MLKRLVGTRIPEPDPEVAEIPLETLPEEANAIDTRSPLERFRTAPKKAFSVTDLVSPAWCELQYWYTLTKHGKKRRTTEMRQGSVVHQKLEDQVHTTVRVEVTTKEDAWALRIWNVIQGLKTLRYTGLTRELEIWGTVDGLVVNGVIDELSYVCPDTVLEDRMERPQTRHEPPPNQTTIADFFRNGSSGGTSMAEAMMAEPRTPSTKVYLCDVKTRGVRKLPVESAFKPTKIQLMLYHRLLTELATNSVDFTVITSRYKLDTDRVFSDSFLAQVGSVDGGIEPDDMSEDGQPSSQDSMETLLAHNNLSKLWVLMIQEFQITLPKGAASLGNVLKAEYRSRDEGEIIGSKTFPMQESVLTEYLDHEMQWWKGNREPEGVVVEEAFKCRSCEFADGCEWRLKKVEEAKAKSRMGRKKSAAV